MSDHPKRIWATVNGMSTRLPDGGRQLLGGWSEDPHRSGAIQYVRADTIDLQLSEMAVAAVLNAMRVDGRKAYLMGWGSECYSLLTEAHAASRGIDLRQFRADFWASCRPQRVEIAQ